MSASSGAPLLLYDGSCGFCADSVQFVLKRDRKGTMLFAALDGRTGRDVIARHPEVQEVDSVLFVEPANGTDPERVFVQYDAALRVALYLGVSWHLLRVLQLVPSSIRNAVYRFIARHRHRLTAGGPRCVIPEAGDRARFLD